MIQSRIDTVVYENGEMQRYQIVSGFAWNDLEFAQAEFTKEPFEELARLYKVFIVPKHPELYGGLIIFHVPEEVVSPFPYETEAGLVFDKQLSVAMGLRKLVEEGKIRKEGHGLQIVDKEAKAFLDKLEAMGWLYYAIGDKTDINVMPVGDDLGYISTIQPTPQFSCNAHFFEMDLLDNDSPYDIFGTPYGMIVKNGIMSQPPLNAREALLVDMEGNPRIIRPDVKDITITLQGKDFKHGENCTIYRRPETRVTPKEEGFDLMIVGDEVIAIHEGGEVRVPTGGFVLHTTEELEKIPTPVVYRGFDDVLFGIQTGSSSVKDGVVMQGFESPFYDYKKDPVPFPPSMYPLDYAKDRAPRMAICSDKDGNPVLIWSEGPSKLFYQYGKESCGTSLLELGEYCHKIGMVNCLNLDGGGSSEMFIDGKLQMHVSDRHPDNSDSERPVPMGLMIR